MYDTVIKQRTAALRNTSSCSHNDTGVVDRHKQPLRRRLPKHKRPRRLSSGPCSYGVVLVGCFSVVVVVGVLVLLQRLLLRSSLLTNAAAPALSTTNHNSVTANDRTLRRPFQQRQKQPFNGQLTPLSGLDLEQLTIRINTWRRLETLQYSLKHYVSCPVVASIVVVWCVAQGEPPPWLLDMQYTNNTDQKNNNNNKTIVTVERHATNSLNERFVVLERPLTRGILSVDDDVLRPCLALQHALELWKVQPHHQVGFDARTHVVETDNDNNNNRWKYGYMSTTEKTNAYSLTLTRYSLQHVDYLYSYATDMPASIRSTVARNFNCEDIAMSFWISSWTRSVPLLVDYWASKSMIKLYTSHGISASQGHKSLRDDCVNDFADILNLKQTLRPSKLFDGSYFDYGAPRQRPSVEHSTIARWRESGDERLLLKELSQLRKEASVNVYQAGLLEGSPPWKKRFQS